MNSNDGSYVMKRKIKDNVEPSVINKFTKVSLDRINELKVFLINNSNWGE